MRYFLLSTFTLTSIFFLGCGGGGGSSDSSTSTSFSTPTASKSYTVSVVDDAVLGATVQAPGCLNAKEEGDGIYTLQCYEEPTIITASNGYFEHNNTKYTIDMPLIINTTFLSDKQNITITPASTFIADLQKKEDVEKFAASLGLSYEELFKMPNENSQQVFHYLNLINTIAAENGVTDMQEYIKYIREKIVANGAADSTTTALTNIKNTISNLSNDTNLKNFFKINYNGFIEEVAKIDPIKLANEMQTYATPPNKLVFTGFIYDKLLPHAEVIATLKGKEIGRTQADENGKWRLILDNINNEDIPLVTFTAKTTTNNQDVVLKSIVATTPPTNTNKLTTSTSINLTISNVTTAQYTLLEKTLGEDSQNWNATSVETELKSIKENNTSTVKTIAAAIKTVVDTNLSITDDTYTFAKKLSDANNDITQLDYNNTQEVANEIPLQIVAIEEDPTLNKQLSTTVKETNATIAIDLPTLLQNGVVFYKYATPYFSQTSIQEKNGILIKQKSTFAADDTIFSSAQTVSEHYYTWHNGEWVYNLSTEEKIIYAINKQAFSSYINDSLVSEVSLLEAKYITTPTMELNVGGLKDPIIIQTPSNALIAKVLINVDEYYIDNNIIAPFWDKIKNDINESATIEDVYNAIAHYNGDYLNAGNGLFLGNDSMAGKLLDENNNIVGSYIIIKGSKDVPPHIKLVFFDNKYEYFSFHKETEIPLFVLKDNALYYSYEDKFQETSLVYSANIIPNVTKKLQEKVYCTALPKIEYKDFNNTQCSNVTINGNYKIGVYSNEYTDFALIKLNQNGTFATTKAAAFKIFHPDGSFKKSNDPYSAFVIFKDNMTTWQYSYEYDQNETTLTIYTPDCTLQ